MAERKNEPSKSTTLEQKGDRELVITRLFGAPQRIVFDAYTKPEFVRRWWAPKSLGVQVVSIEADLRVGGAWRYVLQARDEPPFAFYGEYKMITPHSRVQYTSIFEPFPDSPVLTTIDFEPRGEQTLLISHELYASAEALEMTLQSGMEKGMRETMDQLDGLVRSLRG